MNETAVMDSATTEMTTKKVGSKKPRNKTNHPPTSDMVNNAITTLQEKKGSSLVAIKKFIAATYLIDLNKYSALIRKYIKSAVEKNTIIQTKGIGASGRFKLNPKTNDKKKTKPEDKEKTTEKSVTKKKPVANETAVTKKKVTENKDVKSSSRTKDKIKEKASPVKQKKDTKSKGKVTKT